MNKKIDTKNKKQFIALPKKSAGKEVERLQALHGDFEFKLKKKLATLSSQLPRERFKQKELRESEELFRSTFNHAAIGIAHVGLDGKWLRVNKRFCEIAGWSQKDLLKRSFLDITHPDDHELDLKFIQELMEGKVSIFTMEKRYVKKDGSIRWVRATASLVRNSAGEPQYGIGIIEDIHEKKQAEEMMKMLADSSKLLAKSLDYNETLSSVADLVVPQLADWCIIDLLSENKKYERVKVAYRDAKNKAIAEKLYQYPPQYGSNSPIERSLRLGKSILTENIILKKFSKYAYDKDHLKAILSMKQKSFMSVPLMARGKTIGAISFRSTSKKYSKTDLFFAEQIASRIALAVDNASLYNKAQKAVQVRDDFMGIASRELKTSLTTVEALAQIMERDFRNSNSKHSLDILSKMDKQLNRTTKLINDLLDVSRIQSGKISMRKELLDLQSVVEETVENCRRFSGGHNIILRINAKKKVHADRDKINQVLTNMITNAIKYSPDAKDIIVTLYKNKNNIIVSVQDFGIGIAEDKKQKVFERFFRAESLERERCSISGMGLGLYISRKLIEQHQGLIWVKSKVGKGSTFYMSLPFRETNKEIESSPERLLRMAAV